MARKRGLQCLVAQSVEQLGSGSDLFSIFSQRSVDPLSPVVAPRVMSMSTRMIGSLVAGFALGALAASNQASALLALAPVVRPLGTLWINAILMTVIPLVVASLVVSVSSMADSRLVGSIGWRAVVVLLAMLVGGAVVSALVSPALVAWLPVDAASAAALRAVNAPGAGVASPTPPTLAQWFSALVPPNAIRAASDGAMLPLVVFTLAFALALTRVPPELRRIPVAFFDAIAQAMLVLLGWIIRAGPVGVFALAYTLGAQAGMNAAGAIGLYIALSATLCLAATALLYGLTAAVGRVSLRRFARAAAPAQAVAASTRSSLAALPAMLRAAGLELSLPPVVGGVFLPFAVATFKFTSPLTYIAAACFLARIYGVPLETGRLVSTIPLAVAMSLGVPGVPGGWITAAPVFLSVGLPADVIGVLIAVDAVPDVFRTLGNVTADLAAATLVGRYAERGAPEEQGIVPIGPLSRAES
jgi:Na+/H+-dicarboxylate symporter